jgi:O-antigen/teichoic acid export membrane protein
MLKKSVLLFVVFSVLASALNYIVYPLFSRILEPSEYVNITTSLSLFTQISAFLSSILAITIGLSKSEQGGNTNKKIELLQSFLFKLFATLAVLFLIASPVLMTMAHIPVWFAFPIAIMMLLSVPLMVISGYLNGKNQMIKLGIVTVISASSQFIIGLTAATVSKSGLITMLSMAIAQIVTLAVIYNVFSKDHLPGIVKPIKSPLKATKGMGNLLIYTALTSIAIMSISLVQIVDLFVLQGLTVADTKFYTDIYVVSRVVFFAGMIFIWPFLGEINLDHHHVNRKPFVKVTGYFAIITLAAIGLLYFFGDSLVRLLFGATYSLSLIQDIGILSVLYKFLMLIITAVVLYFVVLRSYIAVWLSFALSAMIFAYAELINKAESTMAAALVGLNVIAILFAIVSIVLLLRMPANKPDRR